MDNKITEGMSNDHFDFMIDLWCLKRFYNFFVRCETFVTLFILAKVGLFHMEIEEMFNHFENNQITRLYKVPQGKNKMSSRIIQVIIWLEMLDPFSSMHAAAMHISV